MFPSSGGSANVSRASSSSFLNFRCCVVGDSGVGKTSMLMAYCVEDWRPNRGFIPATYVPSRPFLIPTADSRACITLSIKDTRGSQDSDAVRAFECSAADCLLICFSVVDPESYVNVETRWLPFMTKTCPEAACILVGTKTDLRQQQEQREQREPSRRVSSMLQPQDVVEDTGGNRASRRVSSMMEINSKLGIKMAKKIRAITYLECSSTDKTSLNAVFDTAIRTFTDEDGPTAIPSNSSTASSGGKEKDKTDTSSGKKKCQIS